MVVAVGAHVYTLSGVVFFFFGLTVKHVGSQFSDQISNLHPLHWKPGLPGKSELCILNECITLYINDLSIKLIFK